MKKLLSLTAIIFGVMLTFSQAPEKFSYQAIIRNGSNAVITNSTIGMKISILKTSAAGTVVYAESQTPTTNSNGLISIQIGAGTVISGTIAGINWATDSYYIKTETDPAGGTSYSIAGTTQLLSVPYALYSKNSASTVTNFTKTGNNIANNNSGNVGIGTGATIPSSLLTVKKTGIGFTQEDASGAAQIGFYTDATNAFLQTHTNTDLAFSTNNGGARMVLQKTTGNFGIGVPVPTQKLEVNGTTKTTNLQVTDGGGVGKVLTSDVAGNATWQSAGIPDVYFSSTGGSSQNIPIIGFTIINTWTGLEEAGGANYNTATGEYTISVAGFYEIRAQCSFQNPNIQNGTQAGISILINGTVAKSGYSNSSEPGIYYSDLVVSLKKRVNVGQKISIKVTQDGGDPINHLFPQGSTFSVELIHK